MAFLEKFGVVTVQDLKVYTKVEITADMTPAEVITACATPVATLDTLKITNVPMEGPTKVANGGIYNNTLIKFGKTARLEIQDALGNQAALIALGGAKATTTEDGLHITDNFGGKCTLIGDTFIIDPIDGSKKEVQIVFYAFTPDSIVNLTMEADGDVSVFDLNGDLDAVDVDGETGVFYTIVAKA